ncbi:MAG: AzlD domain-containing protein [Deferribacterales bacterium]|nr:AzlD domain-containing protein [Deferribacterales bacterium]
MTDTVYVYIIIVGMSLVTYATRETPFIVLRGKRLGDKAVLWLSFVPVSVMSALLLPEIFIKTEGNNTLLYLSADNLYIWTSIATFAVAVIFKNFFVTIIFGMAFLSFVRYLI